MRLCGTSPGASHACENSTIRQLNFTQYGRSRVPTLQESLETLCLTAQKGSLDGSVQHFEKDAIRENIANLCAALTGMYKALDTKCLEIGITYSANRRERRLYLYQREKRNL